jgi:predicted ester cyclase
MVRLDDPRSTFRAQTILSTLKTSRRELISELRTLEEDIAAAREERKAIPDLHFKINEIIGERDLVLVYWTASGTNTHRLKLGV